MKIGFITDTHFGYKRFEKDALVQGREAILAAAEEADLLILGGDNFDAALPKMETLAGVADILQQATTIMKAKGITYMPIVGIHGNHDRRAKGYINPTELLARMGLLEYIHNKTIQRTLGDETVAISGLGNVPDDLAKEALQQFSCKPVPNAFNILVVHQTFQEFEAIEHENYLTFDDLPAGYDLYLCGHSHKPNLTGKLLNPGSTVITQLRKDEIGERGWLLYDTKSKKAEFRQIASREFVWLEYEFSNATPKEVEKKVWEVFNSYANKNKIVKVVLNGALGAGFQASDIHLPNFAEDFFVENRINSENFRERINEIRKKREQKLSVKDFGIDILKKHLANTNYNLGDPSELFASLVDGTAFEKIKEQIEKKN